MRSVSKQEMEQALNEIDELNFQDPYYWMSSLERIAYHLGILREEHIVVHDTCAGRGWIVTGSSYGEGHQCNCQKYQGRTITPEGKLLIRAAFPTYRIDQPISAAG